MINHLAAELELPVYIEMPEHPPKSFVILDRTGGGNENRINTATFAIQSYGVSIAEAASLNERVKLALDWDRLPADILSARLNSDYNYSDTEKRKYRYQAVYEIFY